MRNVVNKFVEKIKTDILCSIAYFSENRAVMKQCGENVVEPDVPQMTIWRVLIPCWIPKATNTNSQFLILIALPLQQWLHKRASLFRYKHIAFLVLFWLSRSVVLPVISVMALSPITLEIKKRRRNPCTTFLSLLGVGLSDIPQHFGTVRELRLMQIAYRSLSSHVRPTTDIRIRCWCLTRIFCHLRMTVCLPSRHRAEELEVLMSLMSTLQSEVLDRAGW